MSFYYIFKPPLLRHIHTVANNTMTTIETLFGPETIPIKPRTIKFKQIKAVYETLTVKDEITNLLSPNKRYTSPEQLLETFSFLRQETKEYFFTLHLDGKNRILCIDMART